MTRLDSGANDEGWSYQNSEPLKKKKQTTVSNDPKAQWLSAAIILKVRIPWLSG